ncbi:acyl carrier protein [Vibrio phage vB_VcorM_GR7B]|nr:acyl carrier protein [Vibrio phage vB_VcorM_GR7B]
MEQHLTTPQEVTCPELEGHPRASEIKRAVFISAADITNTPEDELTFAHETHNYTNDNLDLNFDSLDTVEFIMALEEELDVDIADADVDRMLNEGGSLTLAKWCSYLTTLLD